MLSGAMRRGHHVISYQNGQPPNHLMEGLGNMMWVLESEVENSLNSASFVAGFFPRADAGRAGKRVARTVEGQLQRLQDCMQQGGPAGRGPFSSDGEVVFVPFGMPVRPSADSAPHLAHTPQDVLQLLDHRRGRGPPPLPTPGARLAWDITCVVQMLKYWSQALVNRELDPDNLSLFVDSVIAISRAMWRIGNLGGLRPLWALGSFQWRMVMWAYWLVQHVRDSLLFYAEPPYGSSTRRYWGLRIVEARRGIARSIDDTLHPRGTEAERQERRRGIETAFNILESQIPVEFILALSDSLLPCLPRLVYQYSDLTVRDYVNSDWPFEHHYY